MKRAYHIIICLTTGRRRAVLVRYAHRQEVMAACLQVCGQAKTALPWPLSFREFAKGAGKAGRSQEAVAGAYRSQ